jgi:hypothetical protein
MLERRHEPVGTARRVRGQTTEDGGQISDCGFRIWDLRCGMWDVKYGLPFSVYRLRFDELTNSLIDEFPVSDEL